MCVLVCVCVWLTHGLCVCSLRDARYEIFTAADTPYSRVTDPSYVPDDGAMRNKDVKRFVGDGKRMECPPECDEGFYRDVILPCWEANPARRPTFAELEVIVGSSLHPG